MMSLEDFAAVSQSRSVEALRHSVVRLANELEFERYSLSYVTTLADGSHHFASVHNVPDEFRENWSDNGQASTCPVMQHCRHSSLPIYWQRETYANASRLGQWEEQEAWGYNHGLAAGFHLPDGNHVVLGVETAQELIEARDRTIQKLATFQLFATCAVDACVAVLSDDEGVKPDCLLTRHERECLQWTLESRSPWEIGIILCVSEQAAARGIQTAMQKLDCASKQAAALKALRLGWIG